MGRIALEGDLIAERAEWRRSSARVVLVHGAFELLHPGHIRLLEQARSLGDVLVSVVEREVSNSASGLDKRQASKEESLEAVSPVAERAEILAALAAVDRVTTVARGSLPDLILRLSPEVLVKAASSESIAQTEEDLRIEEAVAAAGGSIKVIPREPGYSTKSLMVRIRQFRA